MNSAPLPAADADHRCGECGAELNVTGVCARCMFLMGGDEAEARPGGFSIPGLEDLHELARGGMGVVYRARETATGRTVAVKMPGTRMWRDDDAMRRFAQEVRSAALLDHAHVLPVHEVGRVGRAPFFTMKYAGGGSLVDQARLRPDPDAADLRWAAQMLAKVADAVQFAHEHGVLHRDLKPGNILFDEAGEPYVADFGLAKWLEGSAMGEAQNLTNTVSSLGTPHYLAPEIASGKASTASISTDVYALGAILYELLCGRPPHEGSSITLLLRNVADKRPQPPSTITGRPLPKDLEAICMKAIQGESADRYASAGELAADLRRFLDGKGVIARPLPVAQRIWRWSRRHPAIAVLGVTLGLVLAISGVMLASALTTAEDRLRDSLIAQSRLVRQSHRLGQRHAALDLTRQAVAAKGGAVLKLRSEAAAALAEPDMQLTGEAFQFQSFSSDGNSAAVTPDFRFVLCCGPDNQVALRNLDSGAISWRYTATRGALPDRFHLSDSARFAALTFPDHWLEVWDTSENKLLHSSQLLPAAGQNAYYTPARPFYLHPTLAMIAGVDEKGVVWVRYLDTGVQETVLEGRMNVTAVQISPKGRHIAVAGGTTLEGWAITNPKRSWSFPLRDAGNALAWRDEALLATDRTNREVVVIKNNRIATSFRGHETPLVAVESASDGRRAFSVSLDGRFCAWDYRGGTPLWEMQAGSSFMQLHEKGSSLLIEDKPGHAMKWEFAPEHVFREFTTLWGLTGSAASGLEISGDGRIVATVSNTSVLLWDTRQRSDIAVWRTQGDASGATGVFSSDGSAVFGARVDGAGIFRRDITWKNDRAQLSDPVLVPGSEGMVITGASADGKTWIVRDTQPRLWNPDTGQSPQSLASGALDRFHRVSPLLRFIFPAAYDAGTISLFDVKSGLRCGEFTAEESGRCQFSPREQWMVLSETSQYRFIDPETWRERATWACHFDAGSIGVSAVSPDGKLAALAQKQDVIDIVTLPGCELVVSLEPPVPISARAMSFSVDGGSLYMLSATHRLFEWDLKALHEELTKLGLAW
ncbi:hypothetical protein AYO49_03375 [Verrucomicrobiaceae bacterium SCGC AG-212-N21]|nr:hypothetical protein AYO49_03375 [Verrucomicrobiaceae bacterium SCGC AG-212-N21]